MTTQQPEALRLAAWLNQGGWPSYVPQEAASELLRLHAEKEALKQQIAATQQAAQGMALDAARWRMTALISRETMIHPDKRKSTEVVAAYMHAVHSGLDIQCAVDSALAAQAKHGGA